MGYVGSLIVEDTEHDDSKIPKFGKRVNTIEDLKSCKGSIIHFAVNRSGKYMKYFHHYLALEPEILEQTGSFQIAHYTGGLLQMLKGSSCGKIEKDVKKMSDIVKDVKKGLYIIKNPAYPTSPEEYKEAHNRLERRLGETDYRIASNNCEHFASYVMIGTATCEQNNQAGHSKKVVSDTVDMFVCDGKSNATKTFGYLLSLAPMDQFLREAADEVVTVAATGVFKAGQKTVKQIIKYIFRYAKSTRESVINKIYASEKYCAVANGATLRATLKAAGVTALFTLVIECVFAGYAIYKLKQRKKKYQISKREYNREFWKTIIVVPAATIFTTVGTVLGQLFFPIPVLGAFLGGLLGNMFGRWAASALTGFLFDVRYA